MNDMLSGEASPVFVGRDAELALLEGALDVADGGTAGTVLVGAESAAGKSRLISEFAAKAHGRAYFHAAADEHQGAVARLARELADQPRLTSAGFAADQYSARRSAGRDVERALQER